MADICRKKWFVFLGCSCTRFQGNIEPFLKYIYIMKHATYGEKHPVTIEITRTCIAWAGGREAAPTSLIGRLEEFGQFLSCLN